MDITLFEKINKEKLKEVIECNNIPFEKNDDEMWKKAFITALKFYDKKKVTKNGIEIKYKQVNKYGRFYTKCGLQNFQREVRKYISGEFYVDLDFKKCHHKFIQDLFLQNEIQESNILKEYIDNTEEFLNNNNTTKDEMIKMINSETLSNVKFKELHDKIYRKLIPILKKDNKVLFDRIKKQRTKDKKLYNFDGSFFSHYLQNIENNALRVMCKYLNNKGYIVGSLMFDGCLVERNDDISTEFENIEKQIKDEINFNVKIVQKSTKTNWKPVLNPPEKIEMNELIEIGTDKFSIETFNDLSNVREKNEDGIMEINQEKMDVFMKYTNKFICLFEEPHSYGWRDNFNKTFNMRPNSQILDRTNPIGLSLWKNSDAKLQFEKLVFIVDEKHYELKNNVYNKYIRPKMKKCDLDIIKQCPVFFDFLQRVISNNDDKIYTSLINYIAKMLQVGKTKQLLVLQGLMGTGKSTFCEIISLIISENYCQTLNDIHQLEAKFNSLAQTTILTIIEEVVSNGGDFHKINSKLKSLTTEQRILIEKKGLDSFMDYSNNNQIINSNGQNPINITTDNRRNMIIYVLNHERKNYEYFGRLRKEVIENIEFIRYYFYKFEFIDDLNSIRPTTEAEIAIRNLNKTSLESFVEEDLVLKGIKTSASRRANVVYEKYKDYCRVNNYKPTPQKYFRGELEMILDNKFYVNNSGKFVQGFNNIDKEVQERIIDDLD